MLVSNSITEAAAELDALLPSSLDKAFKGELGSIRDGKLILIPDDAENT